ncbi:response regulator transcription factor [Pseudonocardia sp. KRD-184]|uniref:DNA-binding response regulator n=2 Tax=Pseudonocardia TaxID=1847 RepID=A0A4Y3WV06_9PSEU|nr:MULTISPECIES: LytTR family DNA-binding domain-containing protein [Pseudonocardia]MBW0091826.1 response regulator transcription factor [Pseudonocardia oceani]MBW0097930.1 response regulator transcription factor [Pseudonocardia oceani]MBW0110519.1 response regulator transcription factor [Pseudonocardia oceani]MBW0124481.1 response regulator transcription factor [Pseudonocardia oceani]MBW0128846.1 response regulator transcription factor [Pseudonocardia oceani]
MDSNDSSGGLVVLAVDDEEPALEELAYLLGEDPRVGLVLKASDATDALRILNSRQGVREAATAGQAPRGSMNQATGTRVAERTDVEVVFLDIRMPGLDGLELARVFSSMAVPPSVVFVTAHDDRAVDAYEVGAVDYLLKPLRSERLSASIDRILASRTAAMAEPVQQESGEDEVIPVELAGTTKLVPRSAVRYVEAQGDYARLHTHEGSHLVRIPLSVLEDRWRDAGFVRIHRSFLVSLPLVTELRLSGSGYVVRVGTGPDCAELPVSRRHTRELKDRLVRATKQAWSQR